MFITLVVCESNGKVLTGHADHYDKTTDLLNLNTTATENSNGQSH